MSEKFFLYFPETKCTVGPFPVDLKKKVFSSASRGARTLMVCKTIPNPILGTIAYNYEGEHTDFTTLEEYYSSLEYSKIKLWLIDHNRK